MRIRAIPCRQRILHGAGALAVETAVGFLMLSRDARCDRPTHGQDIRSLSGSGAPARGRHGRNAFGRCPALRLPRRSGKGRNLRTGGEARSRCSQGRTVRLWTRRLRPSKVKFRPAVQQNPVFCVIFAKYGDCPLIEGGENFLSSCGIVVENLNDHKLCQAYLCWFCWG